MSKERFSRQSFLGPDSDQRIARCTIGVPGLGGGGSHVIQQLAHVGFQNYVIYDGDVVEESNLNRLVGAKSIDVPAQTPKLTPCENDDSRSAAASEDQGFCGEVAGTIPSRCESARSSSAAWTATKAGTNLKWCADAT